MQVALMNFEKICCGNVGEGTFPNILFNLRLEPRRQILNIVSRTSYVIWPLDP
jgi:hypothetical protein